MDHFRYASDGKLWCEGTAANDLADRFGTPLYVYSASTLRERADELARAFAPLAPDLRFAVKSCNTLGVLRLLIGRGLGMDVVSGGELERARLAGCAASRISFAGVGKTEPEMEAALRLGIAEFNVESGEELGRLLRVADRMGVVAPYCLRINPNVDARTHKYTTTGLHENKFGVEMETAVSLLSRFTGARSLKFVGFHVHLGSPISTPGPYAEMLRVMTAFIARVEGLGHRVRVFNLGGGIGVDYSEGQTARVAEFAAAIVPPLLPLVTRAEPVRILMEPGRFIAGPSGVLLTTLQYLKRGRERTFAITDAGMHTLIRPALYQAFHFIWPACVPPHLIPPTKSAEPELHGLAPCDVVGPICETGDFLAQGRLLPPLKENDRLAVFTAGAYGHTMSSTYNDQPRPAEILVDGSEATLIRRRQTLDDLMAQDL